MNNFNSLHLHMYRDGTLTQGQMLVLYPGETSTTLAAALAAYTPLH